MEAVAEKTRNSSGLSLLVGTALASVYRPAKMLLPVYGEPAAAPVLGWTPLRACCSRPPVAPCPAWCAAAKQGLPFYCLPLWSRRQCPPRPPTHPPTPRMSLAGGFYSLLVVTGGSPCVPLLRTGAALLSRRQVSGPAAPCPQPPC